MCEVSDKHTCKQMHTYLLYKPQEAVAAVDTAETGGWFSWASEINVTSVLEQATAAVAEGASAAAASATSVLEQASEASAEAKVDILANTYV